MDINCKLPYTLQIDVKICHNFASFITFCTRNTTKSIETKYKILELACS